MKVVIAHSRYRTNAPSGENLVVEQEAAALRAVGHDVSAFERCSDDIGSWSPAERVAVPARISAIAPFGVLSPRPSCESGPTCSTCTTLSPS